jgi:hypothetical protein
LPCVLGRQAASDVPFGRLGDVEVELVIELGVLAIPADEARDEAASASRAVEPAHERHVVASGAGISPASCA